MLRLAGVEYQTIAALCGQCKHCNNFEINNTFLGIYKKNRFYYKEIQKFS